MVALAVLADPLQRINRADAYLDIRSGLFFGVLYRGAVSIFPADYCFDGLFGTQSLDRLVDPVGDQALFGDIGLFLGDDGAPDDEGGADEAEQESA